MSPRKRERSLPRTSSAFAFARVNVRRIIPVGLALVLALLLAQSGGHAQSQVEDQLNYSTGFLITGNYVVGGVDLTKDVNPSIGGFSTGVINISGVPANADILDAYLYSDTIH